MKTKIQVTQEFKNQVSAVVSSGKTPWIATNSEGVHFVCKGRAEAREIGKAVKAVDVEFEVIAPVPEIVQSVEALTEANAAPKTPKIPLTRESTIERPCKQVWHIADMFKDNVGGDVKKMSRKAVLAFCVDSGIAFYTARTQYQMWLTIQNGGTLK